MAQRTSLLVFGQGPVIDPISGEKAGTAGTLPGNEDLNFWSKNIAAEAARLYSSGNVETVYNLGGETGKDTEKTSLSYSAEAILLKKLETAMGLPENAIKTEKTSTNTIENLVNFINGYYDPSKEYDILGAPYHIPRIKILMKLFKVPYKNAFSASAEHKEELKGTEKKTYKQYMLEEEVWSRALLEIPEYWVGYVGKLNNDDHLRSVIQDAEKVFPQDLKKRFEIDTTDDPEIIRQKLLSIKRPDTKKLLEDFLGRPWPEDTKKKLDIILYG